MLPGSPGRGRGGQPEQPEEDTDRDGCGLPEARCVQAPTVTPRFDQPASRSTRFPASRSVNAAKISFTPWKMAHTPTRVSRVSSDRS